MIIIRDTREKIGYWDFSCYSQCEGQLVECVKAGDYTIQGMEHLIRIERKRNSAELANNTGKEWDRFKREFEKLKDIPHKYCICEFTLDTLLDFPKKSGLPWKIITKIRMNGKFILHRCNQLEEISGVKFIFCENKEEAEQTAVELLYDVYIKNKN